jgi:hypothetical protein
MKRKTQGVYKVKPEKYKLYVIKFLVPDVLFVIVVCKEKKVEKRCCRVISY